MKLKANANGGNCEQPEPGNQPAVLVAIVDLGTVEKIFKDQSYDAHELLFVWELVNQGMTGSKFNHVIGRTYTASLNEKANLRNMIGKWRGKPVGDGEDFDLGTLLGKKCLLDVTTTEDGKYCRLDPTCASSLPRGVPCPDPKRQPAQWEIDGSDKLPEHLDWLPFIFGESACGRIARSREWKAKGRQAIAPPAEEEEVGVGVDDTLF